MPFYQGAECMRSAWMMDDIIVTVPFAPSCFIYETLQLGGLVPSGTLRALRLISVIHRDILLPRWCADRCSYLRVRAASMGVECRFYELCIRRSRFANDKLNCNLQIYTRFRE